MKKIKYITPICLVLFPFIFSNTVFAYSFGPPKETTGAPGENNCTQCHTGNSFNAAGGSLVLTIPKTYEPGEVYDIVVKLSRSGQRRWGFQMTALNGNNVRAGSFSSIDANTQLNRTDNKYIEHTALGTAQGTPNMHNWMFRWTAPTTDVGPITFYAAGNAANNDFGITGDYIYTHSATSEVPFHGVSLQGIGNLTRQTTDAGSGISYTVRVRNIGNISDTIRLTTSGDIRATLEQNTLSLDAGDSTNVTVSIQGSALRAAGDYEVKVKATSQGDTTKTAEITTSTTILPVYSISLAGVGDLTTETSDASNGVNYRVRVTNNGNTRDTISLTTSGDVNATVSPSRITLNRGLSRTVTLSILGTALAAAGEYEVKFKATSQGDTTKTAEITTSTTILPVYSISLAGVGDLTTETSDASNGVNYRVRVTNNGNTRDTISLTTSGDVNATVSPSRITLNRGLSRTVTLNILGTALTAAGEYKVKFKATSQGDTTKTAEIPTTTKILPVYSISLAGVGDLTTETSDASNGVNYRVRVTNNGNTRDTISLTTSGDVNATVSPSRITLNRGLSRTVTLNILGTALTAAGEYKVKFKATSQGDTTKTAEIPTTTKILPVYSISLAGVGDLTTETSDASNGVNYRVRVTNNGNTRDTISLTTSGDVNATVSPSRITLNRGLSRTVTLSILGTALTAAGEYKVKFKATSQGDSTKNAEILTTTTILPVYDIALAGVGDLETETSDASDGVSYMFTITNNGNTNDVIDLSTSGDADAKLSTVSISLASGASAEVTLTISAADLTLAGDYSVKVSATSQGDSTKNAEILTTTTILPVYDIALAGVGDLETETSDASDGVSYMFTITNNGNTNDVIDLSTSGDADAKLSTVSISLASGASAEVTLTISAADLTLAGDYSVKVSATSQGDNTISYEVSTATTILHVYDVMLEIEGTRTGTTTDAVEGITYPLKVTNIGNIEDTILLSSSAEVGIGGAVLGSFSRLGDEGPLTSQLEITLAPGVTEDVMFIASGDLLTQPGEYEIEVTATSKGDSTKSATITTSTTIAAIPPVYGVTLKAEGELSESTMSSTMDILTGVTYTLIVTNTGNTEDTILLSSSADTAIEGSVLGNFGLSDTQDSPTNRLEIVVASEASETVLFTVSGDSFTKSGEYEITVTATSQGDNTKTAELTTTTTITPVYSVKLEGKDTLTRETTDAVTGVSYVLIVSNEGNTDDTVVLSFSAEDGSEGSVLGSFDASGDQETPSNRIEVMLSPGTSTEVTFTAAGDFFTKPGKYEIVVTATSKADEAQITELKITTTISPVPWDINADGAVNILDLVQVTNQFGESGIGLSGDVNMDGQVNILDLVQVASYIGKTHGEILQEMQ